MNFRIGKRLGNSRSNSDKASEKSSKGHRGSRNRSNCKRENDHILRGRMLYSVCIVLVYILGRSIPIPWAVQAERPAYGSGVQALIGSFLGSSVSSASVFSLGLTPWVTSMVLVSVFQKTVEDKTQPKSPVLANRATLLLATVLAILQAGISAGNLQYRAWGDLRPAELQVMTTAVLVTGSFLIRWLVGRNTSWGIGGQSLLILVNVLGNLRVVLAEYTGAAAAADTGWKTAGMLIAGMGAVILIYLIMVLLEGGEFRNTVRRVGINNKYAEDDYLAIRLMPVGTMPVMYVMSFFTLPYYVLLILNVFLPGREWIEKGLAVLNLNQTAGVFLFGGILLVLTTVLALIFVGPGEIARSLERQGDFLDYMEPGKETARRLRGQTLAAALLSGAATWVMIIPPLLVRAMRGADSGIYMAPMTIMMAAGMAAELLEEAKVYKAMESYEPFM